MAANDVITLVFIFSTRGLAPLLLLRWPFFGALACIAADAFDTVVQDALGSDILSPHYHNFDKAFDTYYLGFEAWVAFGWLDRLARGTALVLFGLRAIAAITYEVFDIRQMFVFVGPNIFENFYIWVAGLRSIDPGYRIGSLRNLGIILLITGIPKVVQEYAMHYNPDAQTWKFVKTNILQWR